MRIYKIEKENIPIVWGEIRDYLEGALKKYEWQERFPIDYVLLTLLSGERQGWVIYDELTDKIVGAVVTEKIDYPLGRAVNGFLLGGENMDDWANLIDEAMVIYCQEVGARWFDTGSRRGLGRAYYSKLGYQETQTSYTKKIN